MNMLKTGRQSLASATRCLQRQAAINANQHSRRGFYSLSLIHKHRTGRFLGAGGVIGHIQRHMQPTQTRSIFIQVEQTPNPDSMKFIPDEGEVLPQEYGSSMHFSSLHDAKGSKLVRQILKIPHVTSVFLTNEFISVNKEEEADWDAVRTLVLHAILDHYAEGGPIITDAPVESDTAISEDDSEIVATVKELLETRIRPAIQEDGGDIFYVGYDEDTNIVKVKMAGSCVGCPSSTVTLRNGVENMLKYYVPDIEGIEQVTEGEDGTEKNLLSEQEEEETQQANETLRDKLATAGVPGV